LKLGACKECCPSGLHLATISLRPRYVGLLLLHAALKKLVVRSSTHCPASFDTGRCDLLLLNGLLFRAHAAGQNEHRAKPKRPHGVPLVVAKTAAIVST